MSLRIALGTTHEVEVRGERFTIKTLTARQLCRVQELAAQIGELLQGVSDEDMVSAEKVFRVRDLQYAIVEIGVTAENPDAIHPDAWNDLCTQILRVNRLTEEDAKNSQSP